MIKTSTQLKALVRNRSNGNSVKAQLIIRNYIMERFLERVSISTYRYNIVIKGGTLIASIVGVDKRSTMDIDSTLMNIELNETIVKKMVQEIISIKMSDNVVFTILDTTTIMEDFDYPGIRITLEAQVDKMRTPLKLDFSIGDHITPREIEYQYPLMFEKRSILVMAYNLETILAEKFETIVSRGTANSRMRDFYDIYAILNIEMPINKKIISEAVKNTFDKRNSDNLITGLKQIVKEVHEDLNMQQLWKLYQKKYDYAADLEWEQVINTVEVLLNWVNLD